MYTTLLVFEPRFIVFQPLSYTVTRWGSEPWSRGSYSYVATGSSGEDYDIMAAPVDTKRTPIEKMSEMGIPRLCFAGKFLLYSLSSLIPDSSVFCLNELFY